MKFFQRKSPKTIQPIPSQEKGPGLQRPAAFCRLSEHDLAQLYNAATIKHFQKNQFVVKEGEEGSCFYIILDGKVKIVCMNNMVNNIFNSGDFFGDISFQEKNINTYSAIALENLSIMEINHNRISHFSESIQLIIYKKFNDLSRNNIYKLSEGCDKTNKRNTELTTYIRNMRSQTDVFIASEVFQNILKNIPKLPKCAGSLSSKLVADDISVKEVTESVQEEPALAAAILKTVNSAYYGLQEKIVSLHHAILYLGFNNDYQLIIDNSLKNIMPQDEEYENIRLHSFLISLISGEISSYCQKSKPLVNTTIGILHDVGKIVTLLLKRKYPNIKEIIHMIDDSKIGACLLRHWGFPENIIKIIEYQYGPEFAHSENINQEFKYEIAILYLSHACHDILAEECTRANIFIDDYMAVLGIQQDDCRIFYQKTIIPALLKNKKRLPEKICHLLHEQALGVFPSRSHAS
jgi:HD-like signal output (HDOD) protein/CRP-like cAMP-binding protein